MSYIDTNKIEKQQIVNFAIQCANVNTGSIPINLQFKPDCVILRQVAYSTAADASIRTFQLTSDLIQDQIMCVFPSQTFAYSPNTHFVMRPGFSSGSVNFQVQNVPALASEGIGTGNGTIADADGDLAIIVEFIKYVK